MLANVVEITKGLKQMVKAKRLTAGLAAMSLLIVSSAAVAETTPAADSANAASKLSLSASPYLAKVRASKLMNEHEKLDGVSWYWYAGGLILIGVGIGCAVSFCKSSSP